MTEDRREEIREHLADVEAHGAREHWAYVDHVPWLLAELDESIGTGPPLIRATVYGSLLILCKQRIARCETDAEGFRQVGLDRRARVQRACAALFEAESARLIGLVERADREAEELGIAAEGATG